MSQPLGSFSQEIQRAREKYKNRGWDHVQSDEVNQMAKDKYLCKKLDKAIKIGTNLKRIKLLRRKYNKINGMGTTEGKTRNFYNTPNRHDNEVIQNYL